jgi:hypothetical protein
MSNDTKSFITIAVALLCGSALAAFLEYTNQPGLALYTAGLFTGCAALAIPLWAFRKQEQP